MTVADGIHEVCIHVGSKLMEKILFNISPDWLNRVIGKIAILVSGGIDSLLEQKEYCKLRFFFCLCKSRGII